MRDPMIGRFDVVVVGAGIVGLGAAYAASTRGLRVAVIDRSARAQGASVRNFGHLCMTPQAGQAREYATQSRELWLRLAREAGFWLRESGTLVVARHQDELAVLAELAEERGRAGDGTRAEVELIDADAIGARASVASPDAIGGALLPLDLQVNPREVLPAITALLESRGVEFLRRTSVTGVETGAVDTTRGRIAATDVIIAVNHDIDHLFPVIAEDNGVVRCTLDMLRVALPERLRLDAPLLTGWSLLRYSAFAAQPSAGALRERLARERPDLAALDLNQMYTQLPDGTVIVGDTHQREVSPPPFQSERAAELMLREAEALFGAAPRVIERWQGVYASARGEYLRATPERGIHLAVVTTGIGMTTGLGLAESTIAGIHGPAPTALLEREGTR